MGTFYYSSVLHPPSAEQAEADLFEINEQLWGDRYTVERIEGLPTTPQDDRVAMWCFTPPGAPDAAFSVILLKDKRFEFKVPRNQWDKGWHDQQKVRHELTHRYSAP